MAILKNLVTIMPNELSGAVSIRPAAVTDAPVIARCVDAAYGKYIELIGRPPAPMFEDYAEVTRSREVVVAQYEGAVVGVLVFEMSGEGFFIDNVAVTPMHQGKGIGRALLEFAESRALAAGCLSVRLYTNEAMTENLALYEKLGYVEYDRRIESGYKRVYMRKSLG